ncbi:MAG: T9SS type A sorting domain-containing protein, partial [Balneolaceae bacterium]
IQSDTLSLYQNRFGPDTTPDNNSHSGAASHFELYDFSNNLPVASFRIKHAAPYKDLYTLAASPFIEDLITHIPGTDPYWRRYPLAITPLHTTQETLILLPGINGFHLYDLEQKTIIGAVNPVDSPQQPLTGFSLSEFAVAGQPLSAGNDDKLILTVFEYTNQMVSESQSYHLTPNSGLISNTIPSIIELDGSNQQVDTKNQLVIEGNVSVQYSEQINGFQSRIEQNRLIIEYPGGEQVHSLPPKKSPFQRLYTGLIQFNQDRIISYILTDGSITLYSSDDLFQNSHQIVDSDFIGWPAIADYNEDGSPDLLYIDQISGQLIAKNIYGALLQNFPVTPPAGTQFMGTPLIADLNGDGSSEVLILYQDQYSVSILAYNQNANIVEGFPLNIGGVNSISDKPIHPLLFDRYLIALSHDGDLKVWEFSEMQNILWASGYGSGFNNKVSGYISNEQTPDFHIDFLNREETYNWPNPARNETFIRYQTSSKAQLRIKITTISGRLIYDHTVEARGGLAEEIRLDTSDWPSGAYFAMIEASDGFNRERKIVKIAIVR